MASSSNRDKWAVVNHEDPVSIKTKSDGQPNLSNIPPFEKASEKAPALMKNNQSTDRNNEEGKRKIAVPSSKTGKSVVYIPPTVEDAGESDGGYQVDQAYDDIKDDDRDVESFNGSTKDAPAQQRLIRRKRGRPKRDDTATSESSPVKKFKQQHLLTDSPRRSSRTASQSANNRIAVQTKGRKTADQGNEGGRKKLRTGSSNRTDNMRTGKKSENTGGKKPSDNTEYEVEHIVGKRKNSGTTEYEVKWKGYGKKYNTWEPASNLKNCTEALRRFNLDKE